MVTRTKQRVITISLVAVASLALVLAATFQGERLPDDARVVGAERSGALGGAASPTTSVSTSPIEGFLPRSGEASACREPVGVDLIPGYGATLTINGVTIAPEQMNVVTDDDGNITDEITASRSLSQYTYGPEEDCPNGSLLRATQNVLEACVYRLEEGPDGCFVTSISFDVL